MNNKPKEHILVGLSSAPSNEKIIKEAAKMAKAFNADFTALYVRTSKCNKMNLDDKNRLNNNITLAESLGATISTAYGDDVSYQIAEYSRISGVTKIVIGRSIVKKRKLYSKPLLTDQLINIAPNVDIYIIPDSSIKTIKKEKIFLTKLTLKDSAITTLIIMLATLIGCAFNQLGFTEANIITVYILGVLITSIVTKSKLCWATSSFISVFLFNFLFTNPKFPFLAYDKGYPLTFAIMLISSLITGNIANKMKNQAKESAQVAYRTKILFETNKLIQSAKSDNEILDVTIKQFKNLFKKNVFGYLLNNESISYDENPDLEVDLIDYCIKNNVRTGFNTEIGFESKYIYFPLSINIKVYGIIIIEVNDESIELFDNSLLLSITGECALALENLYNIKKREMTEILAQNEQLRANLLRTISHDLRTPLTSIAGYADSLLVNGPFFDEKTKNEIYLSIYEDSMWLRNLVENILSMTKIDEGTMTFNFTTELLEEVVLEAIKHINLNKINNNIIYNKIEEMILVRVDARLIIQVIINLIDNSIKYSPDKTDITIDTILKDKVVEVVVSDVGYGISNEAKPHIFERFYTDLSRVADGKKSLGLELSLCKSIIIAHNGSIRVENNIPKGTKVIFTLPIMDVKANE